MAIVKMKFVEASCDQEHLDEMLETGIQSNMLDVVPADQIITEENGGKMISADDPYKGYRQSLENFAHSVGFSFADAKPKKSYPDSEIESFLKELNEKFGVTSDAEEVILTPDDEKALDALSVCGFERIHACTYLNFGFGRLPKESFVKLSMYRDRIFVHHKLHETKQYVWLVYVTSDSYAAEIQKIFESLYFEPIEIPAIDVQKLLETYRDKLNDVYAYCCERDAVVTDYRYAVQFDKKYCVSGFVKASDVDQYKNCYKDLPVEFTVKEPSEVPQFKCPTLLKNNWFARPFELFVEMYSLPAYDDFDPTMFLAVTYCLLFGIMFGDLGQGAVLVVLGLIMEAKGKGKLWGVIGRVGITSMIFGFLFGSVFGYEDALNPIHQKLFGVKEKLIDVMANNTTMALLEAALLVGAILILFSMILNMYNQVRHKNWGELLFSQNGVAGFAMYLFIVIAAVQYLVNGSSPLLSAPFIVVFVGVPVICFIMKEPFSNLLAHKPMKPESGWGGYFTESIFEVLEILLSFVTNSMSYLRVGGFILSHAGMMLVVMTLAEMTGGSGIVVVILGNAFVMLLEGLIVGIQTLRLEYYEMFGRYYNGGGTKYEVLSASAAE